MSIANTAKNTAEPAGDDWIRFDAMTAAERHEAALGDPDAQPLTPEVFRRMRATPRVKIIRRALGLSQEDFAARFHIPLGTLRDWEQGRKEPDAAARAFLVVIAREPETVERALAAGTSLCRVVALGRMGGVTPAGATINAGLGCLAVRRGVAPRGGSRG